MLKLIRTGVFETNSSSNHSLSLNYGEKKRVYDTLPVNEDGSVIVDCGGYFKTYFLYPIS